VSTLKWILCGISLVRIEADDAASKFSDHDRATAFGVRSGHLELAAVHSLTLLY